MQKIVLLFMLMSLNVTIVAFASEESGDLSPSEVALCSKNGCFGQGVSQNAVIESIGAEAIYIDKETKDKYVSIPVYRKDIGVEYTILQWIGTEQELDNEKLEDARAFANELEKMRKAGKAVNLVVRGSANQMTAEFPIIGFFTNDGQFFFQSRAVAPVLKDL